MNTWIIPMAGFGKRTSDISKCKPLIKINNKYIIWWNLLGILQNIMPDDDIIFIVRKDHIVDYNLKNEINNCLTLHKLNNNVLFSVVEKVLCGPLLSVKTCIDLINKNTKWINVVNCDQYTNYKLPLYSTKYDSYCVCYINDQNTSSYIQPFLLDSNPTWMVKSIIEKNPISPIASAGIYGFNGLQNFIKAINGAINLKKTTNGEFYVSSAIEILSPNTLLVPAYFKFDLGSEKSIIEFDNFIKNF